MNFETAKLFYIVSCIVLGLIILSPTLSAVIVFPEGDAFSELWLLDPNHKIESGALIVSAGKPYTFYLGVTNHMNDIEYYRIYMKFRNQYEPLPDKVTKLPSPLVPLFEYGVFLGNNEIWVEGFSFSFETISFEENVSHVSLLSIDDNDLRVDKIVAWDEKDMGFYCQLFFELWIYNSTISDFQYNNRYVSLWVRLMNTS
jgi:hypothetical protein